MDESFPRGPYTFRNQDSEHRTSGRAFAPEQRNLRDTVAYSRIHPYSYSLQFLHPYTATGLHLYRGRYTEEKNHRFSRVITPIVLFLGLDISDWKQLVVVTDPNPEKKCMLSLCAVKAKHFLLYQYELRN